MPRIPTPTRCPPMPSRPAARPECRWRPWCVPNGSVAPTTAGKSLPTPSPPRRPSAPSLGRQDLHALATAPQHHYLARLIELPEQTVLPPDLRLLQARGPFDRADEERLLRDERIEIVVSKNAGGSATYAKIEAARALGLPVVMIARPHKPAGVTMADVDACVAWLHGLAPRGV